MLCATFALTNACGTVDLPNLGSDRSEIFCATFEAFFEISLFYFEFSDLTCEIICCIRYQWNTSTDIVFM